MTLDLVNNRLNGSLPAALGALSNLRLLDLRWNQLSGSLPPALGNLSSLEDLYLSSNQLSGNIPPDLGRLSNLQSIYLDDNHFGGNIPAGLGRLEQAEDAQPVPQQELRGEARAALCDLSDLRRPLYGLSLAYNALAGGPACLQVLDSAWASTQTVAPTGLQVTASPPGTIQLTWTPIAYVEDGGYYEVSYATAEAGPFTVAGVTANNRAPTYTAMNLAPGAAYFLRVRTYTPAHFGQQTRCGRITRRSSPRPPGVIHRHRPQHSHRPQPSRSP